MARSLLILLLLAAAPTLGWAQDNIDARCTSPSDQACIDWDRGIAIAIGMGAPATWARTAAQKNISATRAARLDAARNLLELIKGVNLNTSTSIQNSMVSSDSISTSIQGRLHSIRPVDKPRYFSDGSVQIKLEAALRQVVPEQLYVEHTGPPRELGLPSSPGSAAGSRISTSQAYTGLIIDARGTGAAPAMSPRVYDPAGKEVYGSAFVSREFAISQGMMGYVKSLDAARSNDRVQGNPAVVDALSAQGNNSADLVISQQDADALRTLSQRQTFLREARVMVVLD